jgi:hypothetical protein
MPWSIRGPMPERGSFISEKGPARPTGFCFCCLCLVGTGLIRLIPYRGKQFAELWTIGNIALLVRVLDELL